MVVNNDIIQSEIGSGLGEPGGTHPPRIPRTIPRPIQDYDHPDDHSQLNLLK